MTKARAGSCCATPTAARCRTKSRRSSARSAAVIPGDHVGIHAHNDTEQAVANSFAAVRAGARQMQGTLNGLGERCGNANLVSHHPDAGAQARIRGKIRDRRRPTMRSASSRASRTRSTKCSTAPPTAMRPMSAKARSPPRPASTPPRIVKDPRTYEHVAPERVGNKRKLLVSDQAGRSNLLAELDRIGARGRQGRSAAHAPARRGQGARGAWAMPMRRRTRRSNCWRGALLGKVPTLFRRRENSTSVSSNVINAKGERVTVSQAVVKVEVGDELLISAAEGNGPVNALDLALRKDLGKYQKLHHRTRTAPITACVSSMAARRPSRAC